MGSIREIYISKKEFERMRKRREPINPDPLSCIVIVYDPDCDPKEEGCGKSLYKGY